MIFDKAKVQQELGEYSNFCYTNIFYFGFIFKNSSGLLYKKHLLSYRMNWIGLEKRIVK
jgi:hypothetical protein